MSSSDSSGVKLLCIDVDRISNLPDSVLCHILSFIYTKESVQTCVLSKKWKSLWTDVPSLRFHLNSHDDKEKEIIKKKDADFEKLVTMSLSMNRCQSLDTFHLMWFNNADRLDIFPSWLTSVISRNVRIIDLKLSSSDCMFEFINLPNCIFTAKSLEILRLDGDFLVGTPDLVSLPRLECLSLKGVKYECAESVRKLIGGCPVLKSLYIERTNRYDNVAVFTVSSETLEHLEIIAGGFSSVQENISLRLEINAPSLKYFRLCDCVSTNMSLQSLPLLDELHLFDCNNLDFYQDHLEFNFLDFDNTNLLNDPHKWVLDLFDEKLGEALKILTIGNEEILYILADSMKVFSTLTNLILTSLWDWTGLLPVLDKARNLKVLHLNACCRMFNERCEQELPPACLKSSLQRISLMSWLGPHDDDAGGLEIMMDIVKYFLKYGKILQHLDLTDTFGEGDLDLSLQRKCLAFRRKSRGCEIRIVNESKECC